MLKAQSSSYSGVSRKSCVLDLVHFNVCSTPTKSMEGAHYVVTFVDDHSRKLWVYLLKTKDEAFAAFKRFYAFVATQIGKNLNAYVQIMGVST